MTTMLAKMAVAMEALPNTIQSVMVYRPNGDSALEVEIDHLALARAALLAMLEEPTFFETISHEGCGCPCCHGAPSAVLRDIVDAILNEKPETT